MEFTIDELFHGFDNEAIPDDFDVAPEFNDFDDLLGNVPDDVPTVSELLMAATRTEAATVTAATDVLPAAASVTGTEVMAGMATMRS